jgi:hypothetical protein
MPANRYLTIGKLAAAIESTSGHAVPEWKLRRVIDAFGADIPRAGLYRLVPDRMVGDVIVELRRQGWLPRVDGRAAP